MARPASRPLLYFLLSVGAVTHLLWLSYPREVIFDEVHFGKFVTAYCCTRERFFDIHPPHAKLLVAGTAALTGYDGGFSFDHIGQPYDAVNPIPLRLFPALTGILLPLAVFWLLRELGAGRAAALFGALLVALDVAVLVQTRVVALDGLLLLATAGSLAAWLRAAPLGAVHTTGSPAPWRRWAVLAGALAGLAAGTKFTGLAVPAVLLGLTGIRALAGLSARRGLLRVGVLLLASAAVVYAAGWVAHFGLLTEPGEGDAWGVPDFSGWWPRDFVRETYTLHKTMLAANAGLEAGHPNASRWYTWPLMLEPVFYWQYAAPAGEEGKAGSVYFIGNPAVWWGVSVLFLVAVVSSLMRWWPALRAALRSGPGGRAARAARVVAEEPLLVPLLGFIFSYGPLVQVSRALFLYHFLPPLLFALVFVVLWLQRSGWFTGDAVEQQPARYFIAIGVVLAFFVVFSPLAYGFVLPEDLHGRLFWFDSWR